MPEVKYGNAVTQSDTAKTGGDAVTVGTSSTQLAAANGARVELFIQNDHASNTVYLGLGQAAVANKGIRLNAAGGSIVLSSYNGEVNAIASGASTVVLVTEI
jgi:hypothetical protein